MKKLFPVILASLIFAVIPLGCAKNDEKTDMTYLSQTYFYVMNTDARLVVYDYFKKNGENNGELIQKFNNLCEDVHGLIYGLEEELSANIPTSCIGRFNAAAAGEEVEISCHTYEILDISKRIFTLTEGYYNPAVYYSVSAYGFGGTAEKFPESAAELPSDGEISKYVELSSHFGELELKSHDDKYYAVKPSHTVEVNGKVLSMKIDLGGVAKGYTADRVNDLIKDYGFGYGFFDFGLSSVAFLKFNDKTPTFDLQLSNPRRSSSSDPSIYFQTSVMDECVSSSGDNINYFILDIAGEEKRFCHIFDPTTGKPVQTGIMTATVIGGSAAENDALTTAIMAMGSERAISFIEEKLSDRRVVFAFSQDKTFGLYANMDKGTYTVLDSRYVGGNALSAADIAAIIIACTVFAGFIVFFIVRKRKKYLPENKNVS